MPSEDLLILVGIPENYRLGGEAFQKIPQAHPRVRVEIIQDPSSFAQRLPDADGAIISGGFHSLTAEELGPDSRLRWVQNASAGMDGFMTTELMAASHPVLVLSLKGRGTKSLPP